MKDLIIFLWIILAFVATAIWEAFIEGEHGGAKKQVGWSFKLAGYDVKGYHFWLWLVAYPMLLALPLIVSYSQHLLGIILMGYFIGSVLEDFLWFVINPKWSTKDFRPEKVDWYPWFKIGRFALPFFYLPYLAFTFLAWWFLVR